MESLKLAALALLMGVMLGCATPPAEAPEKRYTGADLLGLRAQDFSWPAATQSAEQAQLAASRQKVRAILAMPPGPEREAALPTAFGAILLFNIDIEAGRAPLLAALPNLPNQPAEHRRALLTAAHALYPEAAAPLLWPLLLRLSTPREFAIAAYTLLKADPGAARVLQPRLAQQFGDWRTEPRLMALGLHLNELQQGKAKEPPLRELLAATLTPGLPVVFSLQRPGREAMGLALIRGGDGRFVRDASGQVLSFPHLALARSRLPGTLTYGNTPRGLFTVTGAGTPANRWIGPTPYLHSKLPIEATVAEFFHAPEQGLSWNQQRYEALLPPAWRAHLLEAWWAGLAGRSEILMHGSTINPAYYQGASYYPGTPSAGCLVASEQWAAADGRLLASDQLGLLQAFAAGGQDRGYLIVAEIAGANGAAVQLAEVLAALTLIEQGKP